MQSIRENMGQAVYSELQTAPQFPLLFVETNSSSIALTSPFVSDYYSCKENTSQGLQGESHSTPFTDQATEKTLASELSLIFWKLVCFEVLQTLFLQQKLVLRVCMKMQKLARWP